MCVSCIPDKIPADKLSADRLLNRVCEKHNVESVQERNRKIRNPMLPANPRKIEKAEGHVTRLEHSKVVTCCVT
jgi:hypothetical protein